MPNRSGGYHRRTKTDESESWEGKKEEKKKKGKRGRRREKRGEEGGGQGGKREMRSWESRLPLGWYASLLHRYGYGHVT